MADNRSVERAFNDHAEVNMMRRFTTPETQREAFEIRQRMRDLMDRAKGHFDEVREKNQQRPELRNEPPFADRQGARNAAIAKAGDRYKRRTDRILMAGENVLNRLEERQHQHQQSQAIPFVASVRVRAASHVDREHRERHQALILHHRHEERGHLRIAKRQLARFDAGRAETENRHTQRTRTTEEKAERAFQARNLKLFRAANRDERQQHSREHEQNRDRKIEDRVQALQRVAERERQHDRQQTQDRSMTSEFNRARARTLTAEFNHRRV